MLDKKQVQEMIVECGYIQDIGQIDKDTRRALNKAVHKGILTKSREPWLGYIMPLKTTYRLSV